MGLAVERFVVRPLQGSPPVTTLVATAGVALLAIALQIIIGEARARAIPAMIEGGGPSIFGTTVKPQEFLIVLGLAVTGILLYFFFRSVLGTALLATSQEQFAARIAGIDTNRMSMLTWGLAALCGAVAGLLFAPLDAFTPGFMTTRRLIPGFTAAVLGGITSLPGAVIGGFAVGLVESFSGFYFADKIPGADLLFVFFALLVVLFIRPQGLLGKEA
jgi:branched-chain amino acid transport system permease protein